MEYKTNERIEARELNNETYFIYYTGETEYDELHGKPIRSEIREQLDKNFNIHIDDSSNEDIEKNFKKLQIYYAGRELFVGAQAPEKRLYDPCDDIEYYGPVEKPNTSGIWMKPTEEEKAKFVKLLQKQNFERTKKNIL